MGYPARRGENLYDHGSCGEWKFVQLSNQTLKIGEKTDNISTISILLSNFASSQISPSQ